MNVIIAHHKNNIQEDVVSLRRFFKLVYQGDVSFGTPETTPINIIWLENIYWGWIVSGLFFFLIPTSFVNSLIIGCLFGYFVIGSYYSLGWFMGLYYLTRFIMYLSGWWIWFIFTLSSIVGGYLYAVALAILEGDFYRDRKYNPYSPITSPITNYVCFEVYSHCDKDSYLVTDCVSTFLLKWKTSYDYHISFVIKGFYRMVRHLVYTNDVFLGGKNN